MTTAIAPAPSTASGASSAGRPHDVNDFGLLLAALTLARLAVVFDPSRHRV